jgi:hypothetical protein
VDAAAIAFEAEREGHASQLEGLRVRGSLCFQFFHS